MTTADNINEGKLVVGLLDFLKYHPNYSQKQRAQFSSFVHGICGENVEDQDFFAWLCKKIGKRPEMMLCSSRSC